MKNQKKILSTINIIVSAINTLKGFKEFDDLTEETIGEIEASIVSLEKYKEVIIENKELPKDTEIINKILGNFNKSFS